MHGSCLRQQRVGTCLTAAGIMYPCCVATSWSKASLWRTISKTLACVRRRGRAYVTITIHGGAGVQEKNTAARQEQRRKEREAAAAMEVQMAAAEATKAAANAEAAAAAASVRERQRAAIATPGRRTPAHTPRRTYGL